MNTDKIYAQAVANEYSHKEATKVVQLKKLDRRAKLPAKIFGYVFGIAFTLLLGVGMCLCLKVIGSSSQAFIAGIALGVLGIVGVSINYPIYGKILQSGKNKYASDILRLAREIEEQGE